MASGARSKFGAPVLEPEIFRKQMYCTEVVVTLLELFGAPRGHSAPSLWFGARGIVPLTPVVTPLSTVRSDAPQQIMVHSSNQRHTGTLSLSGAKFSIRRNFAPLWGKTNRRILQGDGFVSETWPKIPGSFSCNFLILSESPPTSYAYSFNAETLAKY